MPIRPRRTPRAVLCLAALLAAALSGCALQSEVMEVEEEMGTIKALQRELQAGIADANEAAETMRAIGFRMESVEERLRAGVRPELEGRITKGMDDLEKALENVARARAANETRIREAEAFFVERLERLSSRQQALSTRITAMEAEGAPTSPRARAARAELTADLETLRDKVEEGSDALARVQEQFALLTDTVAGLAESQQAARADRAGVSDQAAERLDLRLANLEARAADAAAGQERLSGEIGLLTDRLADLAAARDEGRQHDAALAGDAAARLEARMAALEQQAAERARGRAAADAALEARVNALAEQTAALAAAREQATADRAAMAQDAAGQLATRVDALQAGDAAAVAERRKIQADLAALSDRVAALDAARQRAAADRAALSEDAAGQLSAQLDALKAGDAQAEQARVRLQARVDGLAERLAALSAGQAATESERAALSADTAGRLEARLAAAEARLGALGETDAVAAADRQQLALQVSAAADAAARPSDALQAALSDLERRVTQMEGGATRVERLAQLTDQLGVLGAQVTERLDAQASDFTRLAARLDRLQEGVEGFQAAPPPWGEALDKKVSFLADEVAPRIDTQNRELAAIADTVAAGRERNDLEIARATERVNTLGTSLVERIEGLEGRVEQVEKAAPGAPAGAAGAEAVAVLSRRVDLLGQEVPARVDQLADLVGQLRDHMERVGERIVLLETIQKEESNDLRERFNALSAALSDLERQAP